MPFQSEAQRKFLWWKRPDIAKRWSKKYGTPKNLPEHKDSDQEKKSHSVDVNSIGKEATLMSDNNNDLSLEEKVINIFQMTSILADKAEKMQQEKQSSANSVQAKIPEVVDTLVQFHKIDPEEKEAAATALTDHVQTLELLKLAAAHKTPDDSHHLGSATNSTNGGTVKKANSAYIGGYRTGDDRESDRVWFNTLLGDR